MIKKKKKPKRKFILTEDMRNKQYKKLLELLLLNAEERLNDLKHEIERIKSLYPNS
jgi:hypothetical protein